MRGRARATAAVVALVMVAVATFVAPVTLGASQQVPSDVRFVSSWTDPLTGLRWDRYQQYAAPLNVFVDGGQMAVVHDGAKVVQVTGEHYDTLRVTTAPRLSSAQVIASASAASPANLDPGQTPKALSHSAQLRVDPTTGNLFYRVASHAPGYLLYQNVDANTGAVLESWSGIEYDNATGTGVKGDTKNLGGSDPLAGTPALTSPTGSGTWKMVSADGRFKTVDANNSSTYPTTSMTDADDNWSGSRQKAAVDAQYYAALTESFYVSRFNYDLSTDCIGGAITSVVHYSHSYANAFWDPYAQVMAYGDGDGSTWSQMSAAQDVVSHELSHAVTSCHSNLDYNKESGALNEAFSDIMGTAAEYLSEEPNSSNCKREAGQATCADFWLGEDLIIGGSRHAIRNLADPESLGQPSHYADRVYKNNCNPNGYTNDYCGVHTNSGIANHAFYLLAHGGRNARCSGPNDPQADCDVVVSGVGVNHAANIFYRAWTENLTNTGNFCDARTASVTAAQYLIANASGYTNADLTATQAAWDAVGVHCGTTFAFHVTPDSDHVVLKPGGSANLSLSITRGTSTDPISFNVSDPSPATASFTSNPAVNGASSTTLHLDVPGNAAAGVKALTITATDGTAIQLVPINMIIDADNPTPSVSGVQPTDGGTVATDGHVPLTVAWTSSDPTSAVVSGGLKVDSATVADGVSGSATYSSLDATHVFKAFATDEAGNSANSNPLSMTLTSIQENGAVVYKKAWSTYTAGSSWGTTRFAKKRGSTAKVSFSGSAIAWVSQRGPKRGKVNVYIDGRLKAKIDLYSSALSERRIVFESSGLAAGQHLLKIYVKGTSGRPRVDVDGFVVLS